MRCHRNLTVVCINSPVIRLVPCHLAAVPRSCGSKWRLSVQEWTMQVLLSWSASSGLPADKMLPGSRCNYKYRKHRCGAVPGTTVWGSDFWAVQELTKRSGQAMVNLMSPCPQLGRPRPAAICHTLQIVWANYSHSNVRHKHLFHHSLLTLHTIKNFNFC